MNEKDSSKIRESAQTTVTGPWSYHHQSQKPTNSTPTPKRLSEQPTEWVTQPPKQLQWGNPVQRANGGRQLTS